MASSLVTALRRFFAPQLAEPKKRELIETRRQSYFFSFFPYTGRSSHFLVAGIVARPV